jgi:hypothetical protein
LIERLSASRASKEQVSPRETENTIGESMLRNVSLTLAVSTLVAAAANAGTGVYFSELFINPPGTDNTQEAVEIYGTANATLAGYWLLAIDGDGTSAGVVDVVRDLGTITLGTNGLALLRDSALVISPAPDAATTLVVADFAPDIENGSNTYVLGFGTPVAVGTDLDTNDDGTLDLATGLTVVDAVSFVENDTGVNAAYADDLGGAVLGPYVGPTPAAHTPDSATRIFNADGSPCSWAEGDVIGTNPGGPYDYEFITGEVSGFDIHGITAMGLTLGSLNVVPDTDADGVANGCDGCPTDAAKTAPGLCGCGIVEGCTLGRDIAEINATAGGTQNLYLYAGAQHAGKGYYVLGSVSGTSPGLPFNANAHLPLNYDFYFQALLSFPNVIVLNSFSTLDGAGNSVAQFVVPAATGIPFAVTVNHAYIVLSPFNVPVMASNAVPVLLTP